MAKKSRKGIGGRPRKAADEGQLVPVMMRVPPELLEQVDAAAARLGDETGRYVSRTAYVLQVLKKKLSAEEDIRSDIRDVLGICEKVITRAESFAGHEWHADSFVPATIGPAIQGVLAYYGAPGPVTPPEKIKELALEGEAPPSSAVEVARIIQYMVIAELEIAAHREAIAEPRMFLKLRGRNRQRAPEDQAVIPPQWAKDTEVVRSLRSVRAKKD
jgi:hypothetical protein